MNTVKRRVTRGCALAILGASLFAATAAQAASGIAGQIRFTGAIVAPPCKTAWTSQNARLAVACHHPAGMKTQATAPPPRTHILWLNAAKTAAVVVNSHR